VNEATSARVALELRRAGWHHARALDGGWNKWVEAGKPVEPRSW
jgi:3-mercaptopyruvate sulfurtransferase SseA